MKKNSPLPVLLHRVLSCQKGSIIVMTAFLLLPLLILLGVTVDGALGMLSQRKLQSAVDAAAQAGALTGSQNLSTVTTAVDAIFENNLGTMQNVSQPTVSISDNILTVSAKIVVPTTFMQLGGVQSVTYTAKASLPFLSPTEITVVMDASLASATNKFLANASNQLVPFLNNLPPVSMVSVVPVATEILLDPTTTVAAALPINLSAQASDENSTPAFFAINQNNYTWTLASYNAVYNYLYGDSFPVLTSYYVPVEENCPAGFPACGSLYPAYCSVGKQSCSSKYTYVQSNMVSILPLTANSTILTSYLDTLASFAGGSDGFWGSLMVWGWRTIAPEWTNFFETNSGTSDTTRTTGTYPAPYGSATKSLILMVYGNSYWNTPSTIGQYFTKGCGSESPQQNWKMTAYGVFPMTTNYTSTANDGTCDNYNYGLIDSFLGLGLSSGDFLATVNSTTYGSDVLAAIKSKASRVCSNIKAQNINVFVVTTDSSSNSDFASCATSSSYFYQTNGSASQIGSALTSIAKQITTLAQAAPQP